MPRSYNTAYTYNVIHSYNTAYTYYTTSTYNYTIANYQLSYTYTYNIGYLYTVQGMNFYYRYNCMVTEQLIGTGKNSPAFYRFDLGFSNGYLYYYNYIGASMWNGYWEAYDLTTISTNYRQYKNILKYYMAFTNWQWIGVGQIPTISYTGPNLVEINAGYQYKKSYWSVSSYYYGAIYAQNPTTYYNTYTWYTQYTYYHTYDYNTQYTYSHVYSWTTYYNYTIPAVYYGEYTYTTQYTYTTLYNYLYTGTSYTNLYA